MPFGPTVSNGVPLTSVGYQQLGGAHSQHSQLWQGYLASRHYNPQAVGCIGDSFVSGYNPGLTSWEQTWPLTLANMVTERYPVIGLSTYGRGCLTPLVNSNLTLDYVTVTGTPTTHYGYGFNLASYDISAGGGCTLTYHMDGDTALICYAVQPGGGTFSYKVDTGTATNVSTAAGSFADNAIIEVSLGAAGAHTLTIAWVSGGATWIDAVAEYNGDLNSGFQFYNMGSAGSTAGSWALWNPSMFASIFPAAMFISVGAADWLNGTSAATYQGYLNTIIANVTAAVPYAISFLIVVPPQPLGSPASGSATWQQYVNAMYAVSAANTNVDVIDFTLRIPAAPYNGPYALYAADGDLTNITHAWVADTLCTYLGPA